MADEDEIKRVIAAEKAAEAAAKTEAAEKDSIAESIKGIGSRLDKIDGDFCSKFPELCAKVDGLVEAGAAKVVSPEDGHEARKHDIDHILSGDCPGCTPMRDEALKAKGKRIVDIEDKVDEDMDKHEAKVDEDARNADDAQDEEREMRTSPGYFPDSEWDQERGLYVERGE